MAKRLGESSKDRISRRSLLAGIGASAVAAVIPGIEACAHQPVVDVLAPPSSLRPAIMSLFERRTGIRVRPSAWISPTDAFGKVLAGTTRVDVVVGTTDLFTPVIELAVARNLIRPLDGARLPAIREFSKPFRSDVWSAAGHTYMAPVYWGCTGVLYNPATLAADDGARESWALLFGQRFRNRVALRDDAHESIAAAALYLGHKDPFAMDRRELHEVKSFLISRKQDFRAFWENFAEAMQLLATREVDAIYGQPVLARTLESQGVRVKMNSPREGALMFVQGALIPSGAAHPLEAQEWLRFLLSVDTGVQLTQDSGVLSPLEAVRERIAEKGGEAAGYEALGAGVPLVRLRRPLILEAWIEAWTEVKAA